MIKVGDKLKDFALKDQDNNDFDSKEYRGKKLLLSFHPLAWTPVCTNQMKALEDNMETLSQANTVPIGMSIDQQFSKAAWGKDMGVQHLRMLADFWPHGSVSESLDILRKEGFSERANIVVDEDGTVTWAKVYPIPELPDLEEVIRFLQK